MKVLHVLDHSLPYFSGYSFRSDYIIKNQKKHGIDSVILTSPKHEEASKGLEIIDGFKYYRSIIKSRKSLKWRCLFTKEFSQMYQMKRKIYNIAKEENVNIIHAHSPSLNGIPAYLAGKKLGIPVVYEIRAFWEDAAVDHGTFKEHSFRYKLSSYIETKLYQKVDWLITICESMRKDIIQRGLSAEKITVIPNGVDISKFSPKPSDEHIKSKLSLKGKVILGFIGSFYHYEGLESLINMMQLLIQNRSDVNLLLVGDGPEFQKIKDMVSFKRLSQYVTLTGKIPHNEILKYYSIIDIFIYPRKKMRLTEVVTPLKPLEALAMEKIVIGSDVGGIKELIENNKTGLIYKHNDIEELKCKVLEILNNEELSQTLKKNGRKNILENRNWNELVKNYLEVYKFLTRE